MEVTHLTNDQLINFNADMLKANIFINLSIYILKRKELILWN